MAKLQYAYINKEAIKYFCTELEISFDFLAYEVDLPLEKIEDWFDTNSNIYPTLNQAVKLAKALDISFAALYLEKDNMDLSKFDLKAKFRTLAEPKADIAKRNLAVFALSRDHEFFLETIKDLDEPIIEAELPVIDPIRENESNVADYLRNFLGLDFRFQKNKSARKFYLYLRRRVEDKGIFVQNFTGPSVEVVRGISFFNQGLPVIGVNFDDVNAAKSFTLIHELIHLALESNRNEHNLFYEEEERFSNRVANKVLLPLVELTRQIERCELPPELNDIERIAKYFAVSKDVIIYRLKELEIINEAKVEIFKKQINEDYLLSKMKRKENKVNYPRRMDLEAIDRTSPTLSRLLFSGYSEGYFSKLDLSQIFRVKPTLIDRVYEEVVKW